MQYPIAAGHLGIALLASLLTCVSSLPAAPPAGDDSPAESEKAYQAGDAGVVPPRLIESSRVDPPYPDTAREGGIQGRVILRILVDAEGRVADAQIVRAPYRAGDLAVLAVAAVREWRYTPALLKDRPVPCSMVTSIGFYPESADTSASGGRPSRKPAPAPETGSSPPSPEPAEVEDQPAEVPREPAPEPIEPLAFPGLGPTADPPREPPPAVTRSPSVPTGPNPLDQPDGLIELESGGPAPLALGAPVGGLRPLLGEVTTIERPDGRNAVRSASRGIEVTLSPVDGTEVVSEIRYIFLEGWEGFSSCAFRTRTGLRSGSFCLGIAPAHGRPWERIDGIGTDGREATTLVYRREGSEFAFVCVEGRLAELRITRSESTGP